MYILQPYDDVLKYILENGMKKENRTGVDTLSVFGMQSRYRIDKHFPLLTKRKVWPKAIFAELLWMLSGSTNNKDLQALGSNIWTPWVDKEFEKKHGFVEGAFGPVYGFQMRYFGGEYGDGDRGNENYGKGGFDQISFLINELKTNPTSRRMIMSLWNPQQMHAMRLPPCHFSFQLYVNNGKLSGMLTQRSCDVGIGSCANIQFYSALIYMFAQQCGYKPYEFVYSMGDAHIYVDQIKAIEEYLARPTTDSPTLQLKKADNIFSYKLEDFVISDYNPQPKIKMPVAV